MNTYRVAEAAVKNLKPWQWAVISYILTQGLGTARGTAVVAQLHTIIDALP